MVEEYLHAGDCQSSQERRFSYPRSFDVFRLLCRLVAPAAHSRGLGRRPGQNNIQSPYQNLLIKHFYQEPKSENKTQHLLGWGAASLSKAGFPVSQFWLRFKALTTNGQVKRVVFQQDQLIGASSCRIVIDSAIDIKKENEKEKQESFVLKGMMMIMRSKHYEDLPLLNGF